MLQPDGRLVAAGVANNALAVVRFLPYNTVHVKTSVP
jgi:hypothetical protein